MIYKIRLKTAKNQKIGGKEMYLTADSHSQLYRRVLSQYGVAKEYVEILDSIDESTIDINVVKNKNVGKAPVDNEKLDSFKKKKKKTKEQPKQEVKVDYDDTEAKELLAKAYKITADEKARLLIRWTQIPLDNDLDILTQLVVKLQQPHSKVKLYLTKDTDKNKFVYMLLFK